MSNKFEILASLGAGDFEHLDGSLISHLQGTKDLLNLWGASSTLQDAGLFHAAYGTAGFSQNLVDVSQREKIAKVIGVDAEEIVYQYCACERSAFFLRIGTEPEPSFANRFTGQTYQLSNEMLRDFCELTAANEVEIAVDNPDFVRQHGNGLNTLFINMAAYLSTSAREKTSEVFSGANA